MAVMTRITTNMIRRNYQNNLTSTMGGLESSRNQVETGRRFQYSYEDPTASAKAAILEKRYARVQDYISNAENAQSWQNTQEDAAMAISNYATTISKKYSVEAVNGTNGSLSIRETYATSIQQLQESMVAALNSRYGETFVLAGNKGKDAPFELTDKDADGNQLPYKVLTYQGKYVDDMAALPDEHSYIDLGFGMTVGDDGNIVASSAFDMALPGTKLVGYGKADYEAEDGTVYADMSNNLVNLAGEMAKVLSEENFDEEKYKALWSRFEEGASELLNNVSAIGTKSQLLTSTIDRLENEKLNIETQFDSTVNIEPAEAIMNYSWADYAYNSALKVGTSIISPSLLDFIK